MPLPYPFASRFLAASMLHQPDHSLELALEHVSSRARAAWPAIELDPADFAGALGRHFAEEGLSYTDENLHSLNPADIYLALACAGGAASAIAVLERAVEENVGELLEDSRPRVSLDQVIHEVWRMLLTSPAEAQSPAKPGERESQIEQLGRLAVRCAFRLLATSARDRASSRSRAAISRHSPEASRFIPRAVARAFQT